MGEETNTMSIHVNKLTNIVATQIMHIWYAVTWKEIYKSLVFVCHGHNRNCTRRKKKEGKNGNNLYLTSHSPKQVKPESCHSL